jgi:Skp family chaperone for outer membrane proteins
VLAICVVVLFFRSPSGSGSSESDETDSVGVTEVVNTGGGLKIGFFHNDSLNSQSKFVQQVEKDIEKATSDAEAKMQRKQKEIEDWQKKWDAKQPLLSSEQEKYMMEAQKMQNDAMMFEQNLQMELGQTQERLMMTLVNRITMLTKVLAEKESFDMILSYQLGQNLIYISPKYDLTPKLVKLLDDDFQGTSETTTPSGN